MENRKRRLEEDDGSVQGAKGMETDEPDETDKWDEEEEEEEEEDSDHEKVPLPLKRCKPKSISGNSSRVWVQWA